MGIASVRCSANQAWMSELRGKLEISKRCGAKIIPTMLHTCTTTHTQLWCGELISVSAKLTIDGLL